MILFIPQVQRFDTRRLIMKLHQLLSLSFHCRVSDQVFDICCDQTVAFIKVYMKWLCSNIYALNMMHASLIDEFLKFQVKFGCGHESTTKI